MLKEIKAINRNSFCGSLNIRSTKDFKSYFKYVQRAKRNHLQINKGHSENDFSPNIEYQWKGRCYESEPDRNSEIEMYND